MSNAICCIKDGIFTLSLFWLWFLQGGSWLCSQRSPESLAGSVHPTDDDGTERFPERERPPLKTVCASPNLTSNLGWKTYKAKTTTTLHICAGLPWWRRTCLPGQGTRVWPLVQEEPTCRGATKPVRHNWAWALESASCNHQAHRSLESMPCNRRTQHNEKPTRWNEE